MAPNIKCRCEVYVEVEKFNCNLFNNNNDGGEFKKKIEKFSLDFGSQLNVSCRWNWDWRCFDYLSNQLLIDWSQGYNV